MDFSFVKSWDMCLLITHFIAREGGGGLCQPDLPHWRPHHRAPPRTCC